jgi:hypothetical protein
LAIQLGKGGMAETTVAALRPLLEPFGARALQSPDVVAIARLGAAAAGGGAGDGASVASRARVAACEQAALAVETRQAVLERVAKADKGTWSAARSREALAVLEARARLLDAQNAEGEAKYAETRREIRELSGRVVGRIAEYEVRRAELTAELARLQQAVDECTGEEGGASAPAPAATAAEAQRLAAALKDEELEIAQLSERQGRAESACAALERRLAELRARGELARQREMHAKMDRLAMEAEPQNADAVASESLQRLEWVHEVHAMLQGLTGVEVRDFAGASFVVVATAPAEDSASSSTPLFTMRLAFDHNTAALAGAELLPAPADGAPARPSLALARRNFAALRAAKLKHVTAHAVARNDVRFLVREARELCANGVAQDAELAALSARYPLSASAEQLVVTLPESVVATFEVGADYPRPYSPARLLELAAFNGWGEKRMMGVVDKVKVWQAAKPAKEEPPRHTLTAVIDAVLRAFKDFQASV